MGITHKRARADIYTNDSDGITVYKPPRLKSANKHTVAYSTDTLWRHKNNEIEIYESLHILLQYAWPSICAYIRLIDPDDLAGPVAPHIRALQRYYKKYGDALVTHTAKDRQKIMSVIRNILLQLSLPGRPETTSIEHMRLAQSRYVPEADTHSVKDKHLRCDAVYAKQLKKSIMRSWSAPSVHMTFLADKYTRDADRYIRRAPISIFTIFHSNMIRAFGHKSGDKLTNRSGLLRLLRHTYVPDYAAINRLSNTTMVENTRTLKNSSIVSTVANVIIAAAVLAMVIAIVLLILSLVTNIIDTLASVNKLAADASELVVSANKAATALSLVQIPTLAPTTPTPTTPTPTTPTISTPTPTTPTISTPTL